ISHSPGVGAHMGLTHILVALGLSHAPQPARYPEFARITWGDSPTVVKTKLKASGYILDGDDNGDIAFHGRSLGFDGTGWVYFAKGAAVKAIFVVRPGAEKALDTYDRLRKALTRAEGPSTYTLENEEAPFAKGDGRMLEAIAAGHGFLSCAWKVGPKDTDMGLVLITQKDASVKLSYEGPGWHDEFQRRSKAGQP
ncbi:MAG: hypothetical protein ABJD07_17385, partial [Gemmatimonadaceae bacterium]